MNYEKRYERNAPFISHPESEALAKMRVCVVGLGGLGGYIIEHLARIGTGFIRAIDGDVFEETNLNRQILCEEKLIGNPKAEVAVQRIASINSNIKAEGINTFLTKENGLKLLEGCDIAIDALDNIEDRFLLKKLCEEAGIPMVYGAVCGWQGQVSVIYPGDTTLEAIHGVSRQLGQESANPIGSLSFAVSTVASVQAAEAVKVFLKRDGILRNRLLTIDLLAQNYEIIDIVT